LDQLPVQLSFGSRPNLAPNLPSRVGVAAARSEWTLGERLSAISILTSVSAVVLAVSIGIGLFFPSGFDLVSWLVMVLIGGALLLFLGLISRNSVSLFMSLTGLNIFGGFVTAAMIAVADQLVKLLGL